MTDDYAKNLLLRRALYQQQRRAEQARRMRQEGARSPIQPLYYVARSAGSGEAILRDRQGNLVLGSEIITNSQQLPGQRMLAFGNIASQMPAPHPQELPSSRRPQTFEFGQAVYLIEAVYPVQEEAKSSCEAESRLSAIFTRRRKSRGQVAILYAVIELRQGQHPESLCLCDQKWTPTTNGCAPVCTKDGEFTNQQACENFRSNPPQATTSYYYSATRLFTGSLTQAYTAGSPYGSSYFSNYYNLVIARAKNGGPELTNYDEFEAKWFRDTQSGREYLNWWDIELILVGGHDRYSVSGGILSHTSSININWDYPLLYTYPWQRGGSGSTPPPTGKLFQAEFHWSTRRAPLGLRSKIPRYLPGQPEIRSEDEIMLPAFAPHGRVDSWQVVAIPGRPPSIPSSPRTPNPTQQNKHYVAKLYFKLDEQELLLGEYLLPNFFFYDLQQGNNFNYSYLVPEDLDAYMICVKKDTWEVVIKAGLFSERRPESRSNFGYDFDYPRCTIDKFIIKNGGYSKTRYKFPQAVQLDSANWASPLLQNWYWEKLNSSGNLVNGDKNGTILGQWGGSEAGFVVNPDFKNRIYAEYLSRLIFLRSGNRSLRFESDSIRNQLFKIQGAELGYDLLDPRGISSMGCSFFQSSDSKTYGIDTGLNQFIPTKNDILIETIKTSGKAEEIPIILKAGEVEVIQETDQYGGIRFQNTRCNIKFKNPTGIESKVLGINEPNAIVLEAQPNWIDFGDIIQSPVPIYYNIYQNSFVQTVGEGSTVFRGIFTWGEKFPILWNNSEPFIPSYNNLSSYHPPGGLRLIDCAGSSTNPQGRIGALLGSLSQQDYYQFLRRPRIIGRC